MKTPHHQSGFSLMAVIFLIVIVALAVAFMARLIGVQTATADLGLLSSRAFQAARSGIEYQANRVLSANSCANANFNLTVAGLDGFSVRSQCIQQGSYQEGVNQVRVFRIISEASYGDYDNSPDYVYRQIEAIISRD
ncbi:hypothetical protein MIB92_04940 [Aestuariirhabdus sp. Z084]|uniref:hypothetical protein n=1 Tax=Aestuariirhabdus haliotis TaxID=2918751 RepID=UPI00201B4157|nr:hypothetical protein [Aestuariirhabdus haliotis]MCL6414987.1 hypothetical protein [Aestuariirhabdus haliotis]MCL6418919.1 hypothetical protein [Aestuariirhabdus haliotis]